MIKLLVAVLIPALANGHCHDHEDWFKNGDETKRCDWVADFPKRCNAKGHPDILDGAYAFEVCHTACGNCGAECVDSTTWHIEGNEAQDCSWIQGDVKKCAQVGVDDVAGHEACRMSCGTCSDMMDDDTDDEVVTPSPNVTTSRNTHFSVIFQGAREACLAEVPDQSHCPDAFPSFESSGESNPTCPLAIIGAGVGGLYTALRLHDEGIVSAEDVCIFEATERIGGRTYSARYGDMNMVVDAGAYRTWPRFTPVTHALITEYLGINTTCYDPAEDPCQKFIITDAATGHNLGFTTYIEMMAEKLISAGAKWFPWHYLMKITPDSAGALTLTFSNENTAMIPARESGVSGGGVILNIPQRPLLEVFRASADDLSLSIDAFEAAHAVQTAVVTKLYLYYDQAWWLNLGLESGDFELIGDALEMSLKGRYHDGDVVCDEDGDNCHGFLLACYSNDYSGALAQYFRRYQRDRPEPITIISDSTVEGAAFLQHAHDRLEQYHLEEVEDASYPVFTARRELSNAGPPKFAVLATWNTATLGAGGGWHGFTNTDLVDAMPEYLSEQYGIHIVNEAYSKVQSWAEGSLEVADLILENHYGVPRPWDFPAAEVPLHLAQTSPFSCPDDADEDPDDDGSSGGGGNDGGGGATPLVDDELACFVGSARVTLADGSMKSLESIEVGELIATGLGQGVVKEVLIHPVGKEMEVVVVDTPHGEIVGTKTHPVFLEGQWHELDFAKALFDAVHNVRVETRFVEAFYNLEIDGGDHAYLLDNVVVASGLGDNEELNTRFPRQNIWKQRVEDQ